MQAYHAFPILYLHDLRQNMVKQKKLLRGYINFMYWCCMKICNFAFHLMHCFNSQMVPLVKCLSYKNICCNNLETCFVRIVLPRSRYLHLYYTRLSMDENRKGKLYEFDCTASKCCVDRSCGPLMKMTIVARSGFGLLFALGYAGNTIG